MSRYLFTGSAIVLLFLCGCGGGSNSGAVSVSISPTSATVAPLATQQFTAKVNNTSNTAVTWQVNSVTGGDSTHGTISSAGLYTAPASIPSPVTVTISAISAADANQTATASVAIALPISVSPSSASVRASQTQQFTASVTFSSDTSVAWDVNGISGGNSTLGAIDSNGLYTAPSTVPTPSTVTIRATSKADSSRSASATVVITPPPIVISPSDVTLDAGSQQVFTATVLSSAVSPLWVVSCSAAQPADCGSIAADGTYTAPLAPPRSAKVTIRASVADGSAAPATAAATIQFANATLVGQYVFSLTDDVNHAVPSQAGAVAFDGAGNISSGVMDLAGDGGTPVAITGGSYAVGSDGRGTATIVTVTGSTNLRFVLAGHTQGFLVRTDSVANGAAGSLDLQQDIQSGAPAVGGRYVLSLSGFATGASSQRVAEAGSISSDGAGTITTGTVDINRELALQTRAVVGGSYTAPAGGRGTLTVVTTSGTQRFACYPIDGTRARIIAADGTLDAVGDLFRQPAGPFSNASLKGSFTFLLTGAHSGGAFAAAGVFSLDGSGSITDQRFDGLTQSVSDFAPGSYAVTDAATGRSIVTWTANGGSRLQYVAYPRSDGGLVFLEADAFYLSSGAALPHVSSAGNVNLLTTGVFAWRFGGVEAAAASVAERLTGRIARTGDFAFSATVDTVSSQGLALPLNFVNVSFGSERVVLSIPAGSSPLDGGTVILYRVNDDQAIVVESDGTRVFSGIVQRQY